MEVIVERLSLIKGQTVTEQKQLVFRIHAKFFIMGNDLLSPFKGIATVMADAVKVIDHGTIEILQEQVCGDRICECRSIIALIFLIPVLKGIVIGVGQRDRIDSLIHLDVFMRIGPNRGQIVFHRQVHIGGTDAVFRFGGKATDHLILPLSRKSPAAAEFCKLEGVFSLLESTDFLIQPLFSRGEQRLVVIF